MSRKRKKNKNHTTKFLELIESLSRNLKKIPSLKYSSSVDKFSILFVALVIILALSNFFVTSCVIGALQIGFPLTPPLGLELTQTESNTIKAQWWGNNSESYFSGYVVFISTNSNDLYKNRNSTNHFDKPYLLSSTSNLPTVIAPISPITRDYHYTITSLPDGTPITTNIPYYIAVSAFSSSKKTFSPLSNITNITLSN
ncbi:MAG: hypothetical protein ABDH28_05820 [Brevinematia bacterium]